MSSETEPFPVDRERPWRQGLRASSSAELAWRTLAEFILPAGADRAHHAAMQVAAVVHDLSLSPARLEQITRAVSEAVQNALSQKFRLQVDLPLHIRVSVSALADQDAACGWGFFVIARTADQLPAIDDPARHAIELFLYQESAQRRGTAA